MPVTHPAMLRWVGPLAVDRCSRTCDIWRISSRSSQPVEEGFPASWLGRRRSSWFFAAAWAASCRWSAGLLGSWHVTSSDAQGYHGCSETLASLAVEGVGFCLLLLLLLLLLRGGGVGSYFTQVHASWDGLFAEGTLAGR